MRIQPREELRPASSTPASFRWNTLTSVSEPSGIRRVLLWVFEKRYYGEGPGGKKNQKNRSPLPPWVTPTPAPVAGCIAGPHSPFFLRQEKRRFSETNKKKTRWKGNGQRLKIHSHHFRQAHPPQKYQGKICSILTGNSLGVKKSYNHKSHL